MARRIAPHWLSEHQVIAYLPSRWPYPRDGWIYRVCCLSGKLGGPALYVHELICRGERAHGQKWKGMCFSGGKL